MQYLYRNDVQKLAAVSSGMGHSYMCHMKPHGKTHCRWLHLQMISGNMFLTETALLFVRLCTVLHSSIHADIYIYIYIYRYIILPFPSKNGIKGTRSTYSTIKYFALFILCSISVQATNITHNAKTLLTHDTEICTINWYLTKLHI